jgi:hypothetical protein
MGKLTGDGNTYIKSLPAAIAIAVIVSALPPLFRIATDCVGLCVPTGSAGKIWLGGISVTAGPEGEAMTLSDTGIE